MQIIFPGGVYVIVILLVIVLLVSGMGLRITGGRNL